MKNLNRNLIDLPQPGSVQFNDKIKTLIAEGRKIIQFQVGDPDFQTPEVIVDAANKAMLEGKTHYTNSKGMPELREAVSGFLHKNTDVEYDPATEIQITAGAVHAFYSAVRTILNPGDEVLISVPSWPTYKSMVSFTGGVPVVVQGKSENQFFPSIEDISKAVSSKTKAVIINSPSNPTGGVADESYVKNLLEFAVENELYIISDEVYHKILFEDSKHVSPASLPGGKERTIVINSLSKTFAMTGWRIGYLAAPWNIIKEAQKAAQHTFTCAPQFVQNAAVFALTNEKSLHSVDEMKKIYSARRDYILQELKNNGFSEIISIEPKGAFYFFLDLSRLKLSSEKISSRILDEAHVAMSPGSIFGNNDEGFLRLSFAASMEDIKSGMENFINWLKKNY